MNKEWADAIVNNEAEGPENTALFFPAVVFLATDEMLSSPSEAGDIKARIGERYDQRPDVRASRDIGTRDEFIAHVIDGATFATSSTLILSRALSDYYLRRTSIRLARTGSYSVTAKAKDDGTALPYVKLYLPDTPSDRYMRGGIGTLVPLARAMFVDEGPLLDQYKAYQPIWKLQQSARIERWKAREPDIAHPSPFPFTWWRLSDEFSQQLDSIHHWSKMIVAKYRDRPKQEILRQLILGTAGIEMTAHYRNRIANGVLDSPRQDGEAWRAQAPCERSPEAVVGPGGCNFAKNAVVQPTRWSACSGLHQHSLPPPLSHIGMGWIDTMVDNPPKGNRITASSIELLHSWATLALAPEYIDRTLAQGLAPQSCNFH